VLIVVIVVGASGIGAIWVAAAGVAAGIRATVRRAAGD